MPRKERQGLDWALRPTATVQAVLVKNYSAAGRAARSVGISVFDSGQVQDMGTT